MIYLYSGTPGSGKSLHVAKDICTKLKRKQNVIANFPIDVDFVQNKKLFFWKYKKKIGGFTYVDNLELTVKFLQDYAKKNHKIGKEGQTLLIIDECSVQFNSREYGKGDRMQWIKFFQLHRKLGYNVILISQHDRLLDRQIRAFIEYDVKHRKLKNFGTIGLLLSIFATYFVAVTYWYGVREKCGVEFFPYQKKYNKIYDSYKIFE